MSSSYQETIDFLYNQTPQFQQIGAAAYKPGLATVTHLANRFGNPQQSLRMIHVAGTNGKGLPPIQLRLYCNQPDTKSDYLRRLISSIFVKESRLMAK